MFIERQLIYFECTCSQHSQWVKEVKATYFSLNTESMLRMHENVHSKATYGLRVRQFTTQQVVKRRYRAIGSNLRLVQPLPKAVNRGV